MSQNNQEANDSNRTNRANHAQESSQSLKPCFKCLSTLIGINIALAFAVHFALGFGYAISFFVAQVSAFLVVLSSFYAMKNKLKKAGLESKESKEARESADRKTNSTRDFAQDDEEPKPSPISRFILGVELSFGLYRVLAYLVLAVGIVVLMDLGLFCVLGYIGGVIVCLCSIVLFQLKGYK